MHKVKINSIGLFNLFILILFFSCNTPEAPIGIVPGVSEEIAGFRKATIQDVRYDLFLDIPESKDQSIMGRIEISFDLKKVTSRPLIIDFNESDHKVHSVKKGKEGIEIEFIHEKEHLFVDASHLAVGENVFSIEFTAGDLSLNRNEEYLYTLFVPDRASTAFPCFDQPDIKARYSLSLEIPQHWEAVTNYSLKNENYNNDRKGRKKLSFNQTDPIPTYLFAFAAGTFKKAFSHPEGDRAMTMYYRETDSVKVAANVDEIFNLHRKSIAWMEEYTGIEYPFEKFDFVLIPPFQYGGMEHPGSIFYRERSLFLQEAATLNDKLGRASLIAHETAHIWFGDLVTMKWFNDVWSKEVFANFMADKIVNPSFPDIDHELKFLLRHYPSAYSVDRSKGANAIRQPLGNLKNAGLMYGPIIYNKAPVMMKHLEMLAGEEIFREGLQEYLQNFAYDNADWNDLISILDEKTKTELAQWSKIWIESPGMPRYWIEPGEGDGVFVLNQEDLLEQGRVWMQQLHMDFGDELLNDIYFDSHKQILDLNNVPKYILLNGEGKEYGSFVLDPATVEYFFSHKTDIEDNYLRGKIWLNLFETFLAGRIPTDIYFHHLTEAVRTEPNPQLLNHLLGQIRTVFWKFLEPAQRNDVWADIENLLINRIRNSTDLGMKVSIYRTYINIFNSAEAWQLLYDDWQEEDGFMGIPLSSNDYTSLAMQLALKSENPGKSEEILKEQLARLSNPDMSARLDFIMPALSQDIGIRDEFFNSLQDPANREHEPWVLTALNFLHHPLRQDESLKYIEPALQLLEEIQLTGDIFFPGRWLGATLGGHQSAEAMEIVNSFMDSETAARLNPKLKLKVWSYSDLLQRSVEMRNKKLESL